MNLVARKIIDGENAFFFQKLLPTMLAHKPLNSQIFEIEYPDIRVSIYGSPAASLTTQEAAGPSSRAIKLSVARKYCCVK
jgi:hypothetical protein